MEKYQQFFYRQGYSTYSINLRGRGGSRPVADLGDVPFESFVQDALEVTRALTDEPDESFPAQPRLLADAALPGPRLPIVVGHSMGGLIAQRLAEEGAVSAAVLVCSAPPKGIPIFSWRLLVRQFRYLPAVLGNKPIRPSPSDTAAVALNRVPLTQRADMLPRFVPDSGRAAREILLGVRIDSSRVTCPVLVMAAADDRYIPARIGRHIARRYRAPFREYFEHAHMMPCEPGWETPVREMEHWLDQTLELGRHSSPGSIRLGELAHQRGQTVRLSFRDGHVIVAKVIDVDFEQPAEIIYEVHEVMEVGPTHLAAVRPGRVAAAPLEQLKDFRVITDGASRSKV
jgi:pimeloyl-ACP methyl ester carboxylesterase